MDEIYEECVQVDRKNIRKESFLLVDGWTNSVTQTEWMTSIIHNGDGTTAFVDGEEMKNKNAIETSKVVAAAKAKALTMYDTFIYGWGSDNARVMTATGRNLSHDMWHLRCCAHTANLMVHDLLNEKLEKEVNTIQVFFKYNFKTQLEQKEGNRPILPSRTRWCYHK